MVKYPFRDRRSQSPLLLKIWESVGEYSYYPNENPGRLMEVLHSGLMKLYGYCFESEQWGVVYDFKSYSTVANLVLRDDFIWRQRIKFALRFAQLL